MKNLKALLLLLLAAAIGLVAAVYAAGWMTHQEHAASSKIVLAAVDVDLGTRLTPAMLTEAEWSAGATPPGAFHDAKALQDRVVNTALIRGEPILDRKLAPAGTQGGLSAVIAPGKRAMSVKVNEVVGVAGFALPGNYVDVLVNAQQERPKGAEEAKQISKTVLEHVLVLAVAQEAGRDDTKPKVVSAVTLELSPSDSEKLDLARSIGTLSLVLRNQVDRQPVETSGVTKSELLGEPPTAAAAPAPPVKLALAKPRPVAPILTEPAPMPPATCVEVVQNGTGVNHCF